MPQFRSYPLVSSVLPTDAIVLDRIGVGTVYTELVDFTPATAVLIPPSNVTLTTGSFYGVKTSLGAFSLNLPSLSAQTIPEFIDVGDIDNNAGVNHITIHAQAGDLISNHGSTSSTFTIVISNIIVRFVANTTAWTAIPYGS